MYVKTYVSGSCYSWSAELASVHRNRRWYPTPTFCVYPDKDGEIDFYNPIWIVMENRAFIVLRDKGKYLQILFDEKVVWLHHESVESAFQECS